MKSTTKIFIISLVVSIQTTTQAAETFIYPNIYPFRAADKNFILEGIKLVTEDKHPVKNIKEMEQYQIGYTKNQPWMSTYWPLNKGLIADPYESTYVGYNLQVGAISWTKNYNNFLGRLNGILKNIDSYDSGALNFLAPSEKYDLLLGDKTFDLTKRLWDYTQKWGNQKEFAFLSHIDLVGEGTLSLAKEMVDKGWFDSVADAYTNAYQMQGSLVVDRALELVKSGQFQTVEEAMPTAQTWALSEADNYVLEKKNVYIAIWEGICHGWATSSGIIPRPKRTIQFELPDGREIKFYPTDVKALVSLLWANSLIQDTKIVDPNSGAVSGGGVISQGLRCNLENAKTDFLGRLYDHEPDPFNKDHFPRCSGVHPATWHMGLVNLIGKQKRSFVVERKVGAEVDNHPMSSYKMKYFNPYNGRSDGKNLFRNIKELNSRDEYHQFRNKDTKYIVGVETTMTYVDWSRPTRHFNDNKANDSLVSKKMYYDLELDEDYNIIGGQWRAYKSQRNANTKNLNHNQPDFFWVITKDWKKFFKEIPDLEPWNDLSKAPPASWLESAHVAHDFHYQKKFKLGNGQKCRMINTKTGLERYVSCEYEEPRPQPLINVVNKMIELSK